MLSAPAYFWPLANGGPIIPLIFFLIVLATGIAWVLGEHVLACLDLNTSALAGHRDIFSVIFLLSTVAFIGTFEADAVEQSAGVPPT